MAVSLGGMAVSAVRLPVKRHMHGRDAHATVKLHQHRRRELELFAAMIHADNKTADLVIRQAQLDEIVDLRWAMLRQGLPRESAIFEGDQSPAALHVGAFRGDGRGRAVGCATLHSSEFDGRFAWQLRGMAVEKDLQGSGVGRRMLQLLDELLASNGRPLHLWCNAREPVVGFYQRLGWKVISERFHIETAGPHFRMSRVVADALRQNERPGAKL